MTSEKLEKGNNLLEELKRIQKHLTVVRWAASDSFHKRPITINVLNNSQEDGYSEIPASISKEVLKITLLSLESKFSELKKEFDNL